MPENERREACRGTGADKRDRAWGHLQKLGVAADRGMGKYDIAQPAIGDNHECAAALPGDRPEPRKHIGGPHDVPADGQGTGRRLAVFAISLVHGAIRVPGEGWRRFWSNQSS